MLHQYLTGSLTHNFSQDLVFFHDFFVHSEGPATEICSRNGNSSSHSSWFLGEQGIHVGGTQDRMGLFVEIFNSGSMLPDFSKPFPFYEM